MTLKIYVSKDRKGRDWAPDTPHEVGACEWMVKKAWAEFHHLNELYAILLNLQYPNPPVDMLVVHERGLGILELKHYPDVIHLRWDGPWTYGNAGLEIKAGKEGRYRHPREQVREYATLLRNQFFYDLLPPSIRGDQSRWNELKFQTGVCFTNHFAILDEAEYFLANHPARLEPWEQKFSIFDIDYFTTWVRELRFGLKSEAPYQYEPVRLERGQIVKLATTELGMVEWEEIYPAMLTGHPYGGLVLEDEKGKQVFPLLRDQTLVGRSHKSEVALPDRYVRVSKEHCVIEWSSHGITLIDKPSRNGTYLRDRRIEKGERVFLRDGDVIRLGGDSTSTHACVLTFELYNRDRTRTLATEEGSRIHDLKNT